MRRPLEFLMQVTGLFSFWLLVSGRFDPIGIGFGIVSSVGVAALTHRLYIGIFEAAPGEGQRLAIRLFQAVRYGLWLLRSIVVSSVQMAWIILHPRMQIEPSFLRFRTELRSPMARASLANSITLIPGTMTVAVEGDEFLVHLLQPSFAAELLDGRMQNAIAAVFMEGRQPPIEPIPLEES